MRCHECGAEAAYTPEHGHVRVGLCEEHIRSYLASLEGASALRALEPDERTG